jgi:hypothetical protein
MAETLQTHRQLSRNHPEAGKSWLDDPAGCDAVITAMLSEWSVAVTNFNLLSQEQNRMDRDEGKCQEAIAGAMLKIQKNTSELDANA